MTIHETARLIAGRQARADGHVRGQVEAIGRQRRAVDALEARARTLAARECGGESEHEAQADAQGHLHVRVSSHQWNAREAPSALT